MTTHTDASAPKPALMNSLNYNCPITVELIYIKKQNRVENMKLWFTSYVDLNEKIWPPLKEIWKKTLERGSSKVVHERQTRFYQIPLNYKKTGQNHRAPSKRERKLLPGDLLN